MTRLDFAPVLPLPLLYALAALALLIVAFAFYRRARGAWARGLAFAVLLFALAGPLLVREQRAPLPDVAVIVTDRSQSMGLGTRGAQAEAARAQIRKQLEAQPGLIVRETSIGTTTGGDGNGTQAFAALNAAIADVPPGRMAGAILITDGQVHDAPTPGGGGGGRRRGGGGGGGGEEKHRRLPATPAARSAIVGQGANTRRGGANRGGGAGGTASLEIRIDGKPFGRRTVPVGQDTVIRLPVAHEGENLIELAAAPGPAELTLQNNHAVVTVSGIRDRLRVLLVSGEPHAGERVWRNLLKADPSVDLVHFTILRPPDKQDATPISELSLIAFPTRELFSEKLGSFDLVVFDRYKERGILPLAYFQNIANYVQDGGALLISSGPEMAGPESIYRTPLSQVLPAQPTGQVVTGGFRPRVTPEGKAHPVTRELPGQGQDNAAPTWGRWFRIIGANKLAGQTVMAGDAGRPLLVLDQVGKGRVAELMSDQTRLWARGFEGGGPQAVPGGGGAAGGRGGRSGAGGAPPPKARGQQPPPPPPPQGPRHAAGETDPAGRQDGDPAADPRRTRYLARQRQGDRVGSLPRHRRHPLHRHGGRAVESARGRRYARDGQRAVAPGGGQRRRRALAGGRHPAGAPDRAGRCRRRQGLDRPARQQRLSRHRAGTGKAAAAVAGTAADRRCAAAGLAAGRPLIPPGGGNLRAASRLSRRPCRRPERP